MMKIAERIKAVLRQAVAVSALRFNTMVRFFAGLFSYVYYIIIFIIALIASRLNRPCSIVE